MLYLSDFLNGRVCSQIRLRGDQPYFLSLVRSFEADSSRKTSWSLSYCFWMPCHARRSGSLLLAARACTLFLDHFMRFNVRQIVAIEVSSSYSSYKNCCISSRYAVGSSSKKSSNRYSTISPKFNAYITLDITNS